MELTYLPSSRRWRKRWKGKKYFRRVLDGETQAASYKRCLGLWHVRRGKLAADDAKQADTTQRIVSLEQQLAAQLVALQKVAAAMPFGVSVLEMGPRGDSSQSVDEYVVQVEKWAQGQNPGQRFVVHRDASSTVTVPAPRTKQPKHAPTVARFVEELQGKVEGGRLSQGRFDATCRMLAEFEEFLDDVPIDQTQRAHVVDYVSWLGRKKVRTGERMQPTTIDQRVKTIRQFFNWLESEKPDYRAPSFRDVRPRIGKRKVKALSLVEVQDGLASIEFPMHRLGALLALNCACTQQDVSDLKPSSVDWNARTVNYVRAKIDHQEEAYDVTYPLWPTTFALLKQLAKRKGAHLLTRQDGRPLVMFENDGLGKYLVRKRLGFRELRKAAGNAIRRRAGEAVGDYFLGHVPKTIGRTSYFEPPQAELDAAVHWLGVELRQV